MLVSQPFPAKPSQFANPGLQATSWHAPETQDATPLVDAQVFPQAPQLLMLVSMLVSQPSDSIFELQSAHPPSQVPKHLPELHAGVTTWLPEQVRPQAPQLLGSEKVLVSQPFAGLLSQSVHPLTQPPTLQTPPTQAGVVFDVPPLEQIFPHAPQLLRSLWRSVQTIGPLLEQTA
jgi:hypothetical protein